MDPSSRRRGALALGLFSTAIVSVLIGWQSVRMIDEYEGIIQMPLLTDLRDFGGSDFPAFYAGAGLFFSNTGNAYDPEAQSSAVLRVKGLEPEASSAWYRYYNPPAYSLVLGPLTLLDLPSAFGVTLAVNLVGLALLLIVIRRILRGRSILFLILSAGLLSSTPVNYAFWHSQPTLFLAAILGILMLRGCQDAKSGLLAAVLFLKPQWFLVPLLTAPSAGRQYLKAAVVGVLVLSVPFLWLGVEGILDYARLVLGRGQGDLGDESFSEAVLSWPGFFRGLTGEPNVPAALLMSAITVAMYLFVRTRGDAEILPAAGCTMFLLVLPHSHPQEWVMLAPAAAMLLRSQRSAAALLVTSGLLVGVYLGLDDWSRLTDRRDVVYWPTLAGFALLAWLVVVAASRQPAASPIDTRTGPLDALDLAERQWRDGEGRARRPGVSRAPATGD